MEMNGGLICLRDPRSGSIDITFFPCSALRKNEAVISCTVGDQRVASCTYIDHVLILSHTSTLYGSGSTYWFCPHQAGLTCVQHRSHLGARGNGNEQRNRWWLALMGKRLPCVAWLCIFITVVWEDRARERERARESTPDYDMIES